MKPLISLIAAIGKNRELGRGNELIFKIPEDMKFFREKTRGHAVIMGRKTYESIGRPLPNRTTIVVSRDSLAFLRRHPEFESHSERSEESQTGSRNKLGMTPLRQGFGGQSSSIVVSSMEEALEFGRKVENQNYTSSEQSESRSANSSSQQARTISPEIFVIGGAEIYSLAMPFADKLYLTLVDAQVPDADAFFPDYSVFKKVISKRKSQDKNYSYSFIELTK